MSVLSFGELLIDFVALEMGVTVGDASGFVKAPGGAPANVAAAVARLGYHSAFMGQVGDDPFGHHLVGVLGAENVNTDGVTFSQEARTALAFVSNTADGDRSFMFYRHPSADMLMRPEDVDAALIDSCEVFHHGSITFIREPAASALRLALDQASAKGKFISYDPNLRLPLWDDAAAARAGMTQGLETANLLKISDEELHFLTGGADIGPLWRDSLEMICVTYGAKGAVAHLKDGRRIEHGGYAVAATDTTGAGDAFVAAMLVGILDNRVDWRARLPAILDFANAVGALTCLGKGAIPSLPTMAEARAFQNEDNPPPQSPPPR
ncbi:MAG: PfkB family carbohydrate kinase [Chloroflexota bacterium]|nr:PfkB family carbohydrate kinase [Chloroflexota bacterium]MDE2945753.1 PfkB family carbohydrate kinase [Chloroflexota bacterium]